MKKLLLVRHAKAEKETNISDFDRPLKYIGIQDAGFMADKLKDSVQIPQIIITSPALRTKTTAEIFADHLSLPAPGTNMTIYEAGLQSWIKVINELPDTYNFVGLVGHNPGVSQILYYLTGEAREVHTSAIAIITFETDFWAEISGDTGKLAYFSWPKG